MVRFNDGTKLVEYELLFVMFPDSIFEFFRRVWFFD